MDKLSIFPATIDQAVESRRRTCEEWGKSAGTPFEVYLDRENTMQGKEMASEGRWTTWILAPRDDPETIDFLCSCETFRREAIVRTRSPGTEPEHRTGYGIASVFTPPENRGKGYARHMMRLLHWVLAPPSALPPSLPEGWGAPPIVPDGFGSGVVSVLYSDVGDQFYKGCGPVPGADGWVLAPHVITTWDVKSLVQDDGADVDGGGGWSLVSEDQLKEVVNRDSEIITEEMQQMAPPSAGTAFTFLPRHGLAEFLYKRGVSTMEKTYPSLKHWGIQRNSDARNRPFAIWTFELVPNTPKTLLFTRLRCSRDQLPGMIVEVARFASELGMERIQAWNLPEELKDEARRTGATHIPANEHLTCVKWYGEGQCTWLNNEK